MVTMPTTIFLQLPRRTKKMRIANSFHQRSHRSLAVLLAFAIACSVCCEAFVGVHQPNALASIARKESKLFYNIYDEWRSDAVVDTMFLDEENVVSVLEEFIESDYGTTMFGCHDRAASIGITGSIEFVELCGPEVTLSLNGEFWHKRSTVLGRAAMWLNARIPEITDVIVADMEDLEDFEEVVDELSGEVLFRKDKRSEDYNGDRETMEYQGMDPDQRGPFPSSPMGSGGSMINPA